MKPLYEDILALTHGQPDWYDMNGTPRYAPFHPQLCPHIYADEVILLEIACQACGCRFKVEMHWDRYSEKQSISDAIDKDNLGYIHYGDPPRHGEKIGNRWTCAAGDTMNSEQVKILEFWGKTKKGYDWKRKKKYEIRWDE